MTQSHNYAPECPECGHYSMVQQGEKRWTCLKCNFSKDLPSTRENESLSDTEPETTSSPIGSLFMALLLAFLIAAVLL
jgi:ribosomal protein L37AE/L43A